MDASAPAPVVDRNLHPYSMQAFLNVIHLDGLSAMLRLATGTALREMIRPGRFKPANVLGDAVLLGEEHIDWLTGLLIKGDLEAR